MTDVDYQLKCLREALASEATVMAVISNQHNHAELRERCEQLKVDIKKLEEWKQKQEAIRTTT